MQNRDYSVDLSKEKRLAWRIRLFLNSLKENPCGRNTK